MYKLREYQREAVNAAVDFMQRSRPNQNGLIVLPTGSGKSLVIANIAYKLDAPVLVFQPSVEILTQNYEKMRAYGVDCGKYSASAGSKDIRRVTFAMIGSVKSQSIRFYRFRYCIIDECHLVNPLDGMYQRFIAASGCKVVGLTATPYRLYSSRYYGNMLRFLTRMKTRLFTHLLYYVQIGALAKAGFLAPLEYYQLRIINESELVPSGLDYTEASTRALYAKIAYNEQLANVVRRLRAAGRSSILVFTRFRDEAEHLAATIGSEAGIVTGETPKAEREAILKAFKEGRLKVVTNVGVLTTGFDFPALSTVVLARATRSLSLYYQMVGRAIRPYPGKRAWVVDLCGNYDRFGKVEELTISEPAPQQYVISNEQRQLTNVYFK